MRAIAFDVVLITGWLVLATAVPAVAQERHGFWFNGGLGYGSLGCVTAGPGKEA
jgi:hypothetical protein